MQVLLATSAAIDNQHTYDYSEVGALCRFFATQNPAGKFADRHVLPVSLRSRFLEVQIEGFPEDELHQIIAQRHDSFQPGATNPVSPKVAKQLAAVYFQLQNQCTMREIIKWVRRYNMFSCTAPATEATWPLAGLSLLAPRYQPRSDQSARLASIFQQVEEWSVSAAYGDKPVTITQTPTGVQFTEGPLSVIVPGSQLEHSRLFQQGRRPPAPFQQSLLQLAFAVSNREPVLLVGPSSYKTLLVATWVELQGRKNELLTVHLAPDTEASELVGQIQPCSFVDLLLSLPQLATELLTRLAALDGPQASTQRDAAGVKQDQLLREAVADLTDHVKKEVDRYNRAVLARPVSNLSHNSTIGVPSDVVRMQQCCNALKSCIWQ